MWMFLICFTQHAKWIEYAPFLTCFIPRFHSVFASFTGRHTDKRISGLFLWDLADTSHLHNIILHHACSHSHTHKHSRWISVGYITFSKYYTWHLLTHDLSLWLLLFSTSTFIIYLIVVFIFFHPPFLLNDEQLKYFNCYFGHLRMTGDDQCVYYCHGL